MELLLKRIAMKPDYTIGRLYIIKQNGVGDALCDTLEPTSHHLTSDMPLRRILRTKVRGHTAIPTGRYPMLITKSPRFRHWLPLLQGVKGFDGIRLHPGNTAKDTAGCILPGWNRHKGMVINSRSALVLIMDKMKAAFDRGETVHINIVE